MQFPFWPTGINPNIVPYYVYPTLEGMINLLPLLDADNFAVFGGLRQRSSGADAGAMIDTITASDIPGSEPYSGIHQRGSLGDIAAITISLGFDYTVPYTP